MNRFVNKVISRNIDTADLLDLVGLQRRRSTISMVLPALGLLIAGGAIGAGLGLVFAPSSGRRIREGVEQRVGQLREKLKSSTPTAATSSILNNHQS